MVAITAILGAYLGQGILNEHARDLSLAIQDANRVMEQIRQQNSACGAGTPSFDPTGFADWEAWLASAAGGGKSLPNAATDELVVATCQNRLGTAPCAIGADNPIRVTVAICWRQRGRTLGECTTAGALAASDTNGNGLIESPAMLTTLVTCRG